MLKLNQNSTVVKPNSVWAIERMYDSGAHFVMCRDDKTPLHRWRLSLPRQELGAVLEHKSRGGLLGVVPFSVGMTCLDIDEGDPGELLAQYDPCARCPTRRDGGLHLYFRDILGRRNGDWAACGCRGHVRGASGYCCLWENAALHIAEALKYPEQGELFPVARIGLEQVELSPVARMRPSVSAPYKIGNRHNTLYWVLCAWATVRQRPADYATWKASILSKAHFENERMETPLPGREVRDTAVGVATWIWENKQNPRTDHRAQTQRRRGRKSGRIRRQAAYPMEREAVKMRQGGFSIGEIAKHLERPKSTVQHALKRALPSIVPRT